MSDNKSDRTRKISPRTLILTSMIILLIVAIATGVIVSSREFGNTEDTIKTTVDKLSNDLSFEVIDAEIPLAPMPMNYSITSTRDWTAYRSEKATSYMTKSQREFYNRIDNLVSQYMNSNIDADYLSDYKFYVTKSVNYSDLGLSRDDAYAIYEYYLYNNGQYYFLRPKCLRTSSSLRLGVYDAFADGDVRASATTRVFNTVDEWVAECTDDGQSVYEIEMSANDMLCELFTYASGQYDQSLYSAIAGNRVVCVGYSTAFAVVCNKAGIDCLVGIGDNHVWNIVNIDNQWYGVDLTWNDSLGGRYLFNANRSEITKYDSHNDHAYGTEWISFSPVLSNTHPVTGLTRLDTPTGLTGSGNMVQWKAVKNAGSYEVDIYSGDRLISSQTVTATKAVISNTQLYDDLTIKVKALPSDTFSYSESEYAVYHLKQGSAEPRNIKVELLENKAHVSWECAYTSVTIELYSDSGYTNKLLSTPVNGKAAIFNNINNRVLYGRIRSEYSNKSSEWVKFVIDAKSSSSSKPPVSSSSSSSKPASSSSSSSSSKPPVSSSSSSSSSNSSSSSSKSPVSSSSSSSSKPPVSSFSSSPVSSSSSSSSSSKPVSSSSSRSAEPVETVGSITNLAYEFADNGKVSVTWSCDNADSYQVRVNTVNNPDASGSKADVSIKHIYLSNMKGHYYVFIRAVKNSAYSDWACVEIDTGSNIESKSDNDSSLVTPSITKTDKHDSYCDVSWTACNNAVSYDMICSMSTNPDDDSAVLVRANLSGTIMRLTNLKSDRSYYVFIRAVDSNGNHSAWSEVAVV